MARYFREVSKQFAGDKTLAAQYMGVARSLLGGLKEMSAGLYQNARHVVLPDGAKITVRFAGAIHQILIDVSAVTQRLAQGGWFLITPRSDTYRWGWDAPFTEALPEGTPVTFPGADIPEKNPQGVLSPHGGYDPQHGARFGTLRQQYINGSCVASVVDDVEFSSGAWRYNPTYAEIATVVPWAYAGYTERAIGYSYRSDTARIEPNVNSWRIRGTGGVARVSDKILLANTVGDRFCAVTSRSLHGTTYAIAIVVKLADKQQIGLYTNYSAAYMQLFHLGGSEYGTFVSEMEVPIHATWLSGALGFDAAGVGYAFYYAGYTEFYRLYKWTVSLSGEAPAPTLTVTQYEYVLPDLSAEPYPFLSFGGELLSAYIARDYQSTHVRLQRKVYRGEPPVASMQNTGFVAHRPGVPYGDVGHEFIDDSGRVCLYIIPTSSTQADVYLAKPYDDTANYSAVSPQGVLLDSGYGNATVIAFTVRVVGDVALVVVSRANYVSPKYYVYETAYLVNIETRSFTQVTYPTGATSILPIAAVEES